MGARTQHRTVKQSASTIPRQLRARLEHERLVLCEQLSDFRADTDINRWRNAGSDADLADNGSAQYEREQAASLACHARRLLEAVEAALARMDTGTYGLCEVCSEPIPEARLETLPHASRCVACQRLDERLPA